MAIQLECPGCKATLQIDASLAGKQGKCIHCGHRVIVPAAKAAGPISSTLFEATPEAMLRELGARGHSAVLFVFKPPADGSCDLSGVPESDLKCIVTDDINAARFGQFVASVAQRFGPRKRVQPAPAPAPAQLLYELKGDRLGMSLDEFKRKYARVDLETRERLPVCSDEAWGANKAALHVEPWHDRAGIVHGRIDLPSEDNSPTVAGVKTDLLLYHFIDGQLFRISATFPTDLFHVVSDAAVKKYGPVSAETQKPRQLLWDNELASIVLTRGQVHPPEASTLHVVHKKLAALAEERMPKGVGDI